MKINIVFSCIGVMLLELESESSEKVAVTNSYLNGDTLQPLLTNLFYYRHYVQNDWNDSFPFSYESVWGDDFEQYKLIISAHSTLSEIKIEVHQYFSESPTKLKTIFKGAISFDSFFLQIYEALDIILKEHGLIGYNKVWEVGNFPICEYLTLKSEINKIQLLNIEYINVDDSWKSKISLESEIDLLVSPASPSVF